METMAETSDGGDTTKRTSLRRGRRPAVRVDLDSNAMRRDLLNSPIYNSEEMERVLVGISQKMIAEMEARNMTMLSLSKIACISQSHMSKILSAQTVYGIDKFICIASALNVSPAKLFPQDDNYRMTETDKVDEMMKGLDLRGRNAIVTACSAFCNELNRMRVS